MGVIYTNNILYLYVAELWSLIKFLRASISADMYALNHTRVWNLRWSVVCIGYGVIGVIYPFGDISLKRGGPHFQDKNKTGEENEKKVF